MVRSGEDPTRPVAALRYTDFPLSHEGSATVSCSRHGSEPRGPHILVAWPLRAATVNLAYG